MATVKTTKRPEKKPVNQKPVKVGSQPNRPMLSSSLPADFTVPSMKLTDGRRVADLLQDRLTALQDLALTLKHIHWNVVGPHFMSVHTMLDNQHAGVVAMIDALAERVATLGGVPSGLAGRLVAARTWDDYSLDRADAVAHLGALDLVYQGVITYHRGAIDATEKADPVSSDVLVGQSGDLELYHWFVRSHLASADGSNPTRGAVTEPAAARKALAKDSNRH